jgi:potassium uptake TrkH family protein
LKRQWLGATKGNIFFSLTPVQLIVFGYFVFVMMGAVLLSLPFSLKPGVQLSPMDALFTATSAVSVTGLAVANTPDTFSLTGRIILVFLIQFGGIGIMTLGTLLYVLLGNQVNLRNRMMIMVDQNQTSMQGLVNLMLFIFKIAIAFELIGAVILTVYFWTYYDMSLLNAFGTGLFHSVSGFTNAGFDLFGSSLWKFSHDYLFQLVMSVLLMAGSIGFPVLLEIYAYIEAIRKGRNFRFSLYTKLTTVTFGLLLAGGFVFCLLSEMNGSLSGLPWYQKAAVSMFNSLNTRSGGFSSFDMRAFGEATLIFFCLLMFIGGSPSSCGGGIRTTTFAVVMLSLVSSLRGRSTVKIFHRELFDNDILKAFTVFMIAFVLVCASVILLLELEPFSATEIVFEVCSAFGTTGLSMGITGELSSPGKTIIIILMFIGRIGLVSLLLLFKKPRNEINYHFVKERVIVG